MAITASTGSDAMARATFSAIAPILGSFLSAATLASWVSEVSRFSSPVARSRSGSVACGGSATSIRAHAGESRTTPPSSRARSRHARAGDDSSRRVERAPARAPPPPSSRQRSPRSTAASRTGLTATSRRPI